MSQIDAGGLSKLLSKGISLRQVEPHIYSVFQDNEVGNTYDNKFGNFYDWVACNPLYNRLIWGYSIAKFASLTYNALTSSKKGCILDLGCGSLAFNAQTYAKYSERPVVLLDQSLKLLRIAKTRIVKANGNVPLNMIFLHADALQLPFEPNSFNTIISLNLLHVLDDLKNLLAGLMNISTKDSSIYFTTLVRGNRLADKYLKVWEDAGEVVSRDINQLHSIFNEIGMSIEYDIKGNMAFIKSRN